MIQAVILAGGLGTRMRPRTETVPKPLLPVLGRPFLEYQIKLLRSQGITRILVLAGHLGELIQEHFGDGSTRGVQVSYSFEPPGLLGTGGALKNAESALEEDFLLLNGDTLLEIDYAALTHTFRESGKWALLTAARRSGTAPGNLLIDARGAVLDYSKRNPRGEHVDAGVAAYSRRILALIPPARACSLEEEVYPQLIARGEVAALPLDTTFFDMGTPAGLAALEAHLA
jgi:NDP-sugar pyrophosphorylase family protein